MWVRMSTETLSSVFVIFNGENEVFPAPAPPVALPMVILVRAAETEVDDRDRADDTWSAR